MNELLRRNAKKVAVALTAMVVSVVWAFPARAEGEAPADFTVAALSQYIWRGQELSKDSIVIQPSALESIDDSQEFYLNLGFDVLLAPALTVYKDFDSYAHWYILLGLSHVFQFSNTASLELVASGSYLLSEDAEAYPKIDSNGVATTDKFSNLHDGVVSASLPIVVGIVTITPTVSYVFPLSEEASDEMKWRSFDGDTDTFVYGGVMVGLAF